MTMQKLAGILTVLLPFFSLAQAPTPQSVKSNIEYLGTNLPQEKIYIQFDKPAYAPGETVWFKAYIMSGIDPSTISTNFYCDFADADGNILKHVVLPLVHSSSAGNFDIPSSYTGK